MSNFPPLRKLQFVIAHQLHFRRAAESLNTSQPSMSRQIREFEHEVGFQIFRRDHHSVEPTEAGQSFIANVDQMISRLNADFQRAKDAARNIARRSSATFIIGHSPFVPASLRRKIRSIQRRQFAYLNLQFRTVFAPALVASIGSGAFQAGVTYCKRNYTGVVTQPAQRLAKLSGKLEQKACSKTSSFAPLEGSGLEQIPIGSDSGRPGHP